MERIREMNNNVVNYNRNGLNHTWNNDHGVKIQVPGIKKRGEGTDTPPISDAGAIGISALGLLAIGFILL